MSKLPATDGRTQVASGSKNLLHRPKKSKEIQKEMKAFCCHKERICRFGAR